jgi:hypothetical protein
VRFIGVKSSKKQKRKLAKANCLQCGKEIFLVHPNDPFCSAKCRREYRRTHAESRKQELSLSARAGRLVFKDVKGWGKLRPELAKKGQSSTSQELMLFLERPTQELSKEIVEYLREESFGYPFHDRRLHATINKFWTKMYPNMSSHRRLIDRLPSRLRPEIDSKKQEAESLAFQKILNDRKQYIDSLAQKLIKWAWERAIKRLTRTDVKMFLMDQRMKIPISAERILHREVKLKYRYLPPWKR